jgi:2-oxoisovalerate dehydrogenase E2 component (dihydrolipoyl transacylase)
LIRIAVAGGNDAPEAVTAAPVAMAAAPVAVIASATMAPPPSPPVLAKAATAATPAISAQPSHSIAPQPARTPVAARPKSAVATDRPIASPSVRRRAWELGVDLKAVAATGPGGRVTHADVEALAASNPSASSGDAAAAGYAERGGEEAIPVIGLRRRIAMKMQDSKRRIPHFAYVEEVDVTEVEALRAQLNSKWADQRPRLTLLPLLARAIVLAVREHPVVNARFDDEAGVVTRFGAVHLGVATQTSNGLMVTVVQHAEALDLWSTAAEVARLAEAARAGRATRTELTGSTITISSLGALGGIASTPVINHPEVAIVGVNRIVERPVMRGAGVVARQMMNLSSSFDHRVVDGIDAARFIQAVRGFLESPATMFVA